MGKLIEIENRYYKKCNVVMLPTEDNSVLCRNYSTLEFASLKGQKFVNIGSTKPQHLYITSDDEIKEGDWCIITTENGNRFIKKFNKDLEYIFCKKVIVTTNKSLVVDFKGYEYGTGKEINAKVYLPQPSQSFIKKYCEQDGIDKVLVEYETNYINWKHDDKIEALIDTIELKTDSHNTITIKRLKDSYTREEVENLLFRYAEDEHAWFSSKSEIESFNNWIKENL